MLTKNKESMNPPPPLGPTDEELRLERVKKSEQYHEDFADQVAELQPIPDDNAIMVTSRYKRRRGTGAATLAYQEKKKHEISDNFLSRLFGGSAALNVNVQSIVLGIVDAFSAHAQKDKKITVPTNNEKDDPEAKLVEQDGYIFEQIAVSDKTKEALLLERRKIDAKQREIKGLYDRGLYGPFPQHQELHNLAQAYSMQLHPVSGRYIHALLRIQALEQEHNAHGHLPCKAMATIFRLRAQGVTSRGIRVNLADVLDNDPAEMNMTEHDKAHVNRQTTINAPAPGLRLQ